MYLGNLKSPLSGAVSGLLGFFNDRLLPPLGGFAVLVNARADTGSKQILTANIFKLDLIIFRWFQKLNVRSIGWLVGLLIIYQQ